MRGQRSGALHMWSRYIISIIAVAASAAMISARASAQRVNYWGSFQTSSGKYMFTESVVSHVITNGLTVRAGRWQVGGSWPLIIQNSGVLTYLGGRGLPTGGRNSGIMRDRDSGEQVPMSGRGRRIAPAVMDAAIIDSSQIPPAPGSYVARFGDPLIQGSVDLIASRRSDLRLQGQLFAKLPFADISSGVGSGELDYGAGLSVSTIMRRTFMYADASYWVIGDMPDLPLRDVVNAGAGIGWTLDERARWSVLGTFAVSTSIVENAEAPLSAGIGMGFAATASTLLSAGVTAGLSESSPTWSAFVGWGVRR